MMMPGKTSRNGLFHSGPILNTGKWTEIWERSYNIWKLTCFTDYFSSKIITEKL